MPQRCWFITLLLLVIVLQKEVAQSLFLPRRGQDKAKQNTRSFATVQDRIPVDRSPVETMPSFEESTVAQDHVATSTTPHHKTLVEPSVLSKLIRRFRVFALAGRVFLSYKVVKFQEKRLRKRLGFTDKDESQNDDNAYEDHPDIVALWDRAHELNANRILQGINSLQGFWIKVGQYLSSRADIMPRQYLQILSSLQDGVPEKPFEDIEATLSEELTPEATKLIKHIDTNPLSTASLAQVHRATLTDGREVVLKVQHRGVASLMLQDMENLRTILRLLAMSEPDMDYNPIADEYTKEVRKELSFRSEAHNMAKVKKLLQEQKICAIVPEVVPELVTDRILVMEYCEGFPIRDKDNLDKYRVDRNLLLERVCKAWAAQMHISGTFNADPHPGNILVSTKNDINDSSVPVLLDFGLTKCLSLDKKIAFSRMVHASHENDIDALLESFEEMGLKLNRHDPFQDMQVMQTAFADPTPQSEAAEAKRDRTKQYKQQQEAMRKDQGLEKGQKLRNPVDAWPSELIFFFRVSAMLRGLCSRLEVRYGYLACMAEAAAETLRQAVSQEEHAVAHVYHSPDAPTSNLQTRLTKMIEKLIQENQTTGMQICVVHKGQVIANVAAGILGTVNPRPVKPSSLFNIFSVSKAVLASATLKMLQEHNISVDERIAKYWPAFGDSHPLKKDITIRHALAHQAGLANAFPEKASIELLTNWELMKAFIAGPDAVPSHPPGQQTHYHYLSFAWILGGLIEEITGRPYEEFISTRLLEPLGLENEIHMGGLPDDIAREELAVLTARTLQNQQSRETQARARETKTELPKFQGREQLMNPSVFNMRKVRSAKIPSANGHASAQALAKILYGVVNGGLLSETLLHEASAPQESVVARGSNAMLDNSLASFGLGFQLHKLKNSQESTFNCIGHAGFGGSVVLAVPELEMSVAFTTNELQLKSLARTQLLIEVLKEFQLEAPMSLVQ